MYGYSAGNNDGSLDSQLADGAQAASNLSCHSREPLIVKSSIPEELVLVVLGVCVEQEDMPSCSIIFYTVAVEQEDMFSCST